MLDKFFVRVRSWLHADPAGDLDKRGRGAKDPSQAGSPPPLPSDALPATESDSGIVISESGIIILGPTAGEAGRPKPPPTRTAVPDESAWALPTLPRPGSATPAGGTVAPPPSAVRSEASSSGHSSSQELDWDQVLARARAQIAAVPDPGPRKKQNGTK